MPKASLGERHLRTALRALDEHLNWPSQARLVLIGGAAAILTGLLRSRVTVDCDVVHHEPKAAWAAVADAARSVARELLLPPDWLNAETETIAHRLPDGWRERTLTVHRSDRIEVVAIGRQDLIAMKCIAGRPADIEDLRRLAVTAGEAAFVRDYLRKLADRHPAREREHVTDALDLLDHGGLVHEP